MHALGVGVLSSSEVTLARPGREEKQDSRLHDRTHAACLSGSEREQRPGGTFHAVIADDQLEATGDDLNDRMLVNSVIPHLVSGIQVDENAAAFGPGEQHSWLPLAVCVDRGQVPALHSRPS